jgi:hypothetical protein
MTSPSLGFVMLRRGKPDERLRAPPRSAGQVGDASLPQALVLWDYEIQHLVAYGAKRISGKKRRPILRSDTRRSA